MVPDRLGPDHQGGRHRRFGCPRTAPLSGPEANSSLGAWRRRRPDRVPVAARTAEERTGRRNGRPVTVGWAVVAGRRREDQSGRSVRGNRADHGKTASPVTTEAGAPGSLPAVGRSSTSGKGGPPRPGGQPAGLAAGGTGSRRDWQRPPGSVWTSVESHSPPSRSRASVAAVEPRCGPDPVLTWRATVTRQNG